MINYTQTIINFHNILFFYQMILNTNQFICMKI